MTTSFEMMKSQLEVARDVCRTMLKHEPTKGSVLTVSQQIEQVLMYLSDIMNTHEVVKKRDRL